MIVIGDVHGEYEKLMRLMDKLPQTEKICFVGDLIDRGPDSKKVLEFVKNSGYTTVLGNHEDMAANDHRTWAMNGANVTIENFGEYADWCDSEWSEWFNTLPLFAEFNYNNKRYLISHSFAYNAEETPSYEVLWGRDAVYAGIQDKEYYAADEKYDDGFINIFGHTPLKSEAKKILDRHWLIDTGACYKDSGGRLSAIDLTTEQIYFTE